MVVSIKAIALTPLSFREARPFSPQSRGAVARASTLEVPLPSTFAGALAQIAWYEGGCGAEGDSQNPFKGTYECLRKLFGPKFVLRGPFLEVDKRIAVSSYQGPVYLPNERELEDIVKKIKGEKEIERKAKILFENVDKCAKEVERKIAIEERVGVWLNRSEKVSLGAKAERPVASLYLQSKVHLNVGVSYFVEAFSQSKIKKVITFGGDGGIASFVSLNEGLLQRYLEGLWKSDGGVCLVYLATPLLLERLPKSYESAGREIAEELKRLMPFELSALAVYPHKTYVRPLSLGWDLAKGKGRPLALSVAPGALFKGYCEDWKKVYEEGAGRFKELGYGTLVPLPLGH